MMRPISSGSETAEPDSRSGEPQLMQNRAIGGFSDPEPEQVSLASALMCREV